jgi:hypothetical protein
VIPLAQIGTILTRALQPIAKVKPKTLRLLDESRKSLMAPGQQFAISHFPNYTLPEIIKHNSAAEMYN